MRIVGGTLGSRRLVKPPAGVRPTSDRVRESVFGRLAARRQIDGARVLDLFAGTGALAIEALSRGAENAVLVDRARAALDAVEQNLSRLGLQERARVLRGDAQRWAARLTAASESFELVFLDPPYGSDDASGILELIAAGGLLSPAGTVVLETSKRHSLVPVPGLEVRDERRYGETIVVELMRSGS